MKDIERKLYSSWVNARPHVTTYGKNGYGEHRDVIVVRDDGSRLYNLWGTTLCFMNKRGTFYFRVTDEGNRHSFTCMSQTSKSRINNLLNFGYIIQKDYHNYLVINTFKNGKREPKETKLEHGNWYKIVNGEVVKMEGLPHGMLN